MQSVLDLTLILLLVALACLVYVPALWGQFLFDDMLVVERVTYVRHSKNRDPATWDISKTATWRGLWIQMIIGRHKRALAYWLFRRDMFVHDYKTFGWHAENAAIHSVNTTAIYALLRFGYDMYSSFAGALLFLAYPLAASSVAYISGRSSSLCGMFYLLSLIAMLVGGWAWLLVPPLVYLGLMAKEEIVVLPVTFLLWWWLW